MINWNNDILKVNIFLRNKQINNTYPCTSYVHFGANLRSVVKTRVSPVTNRK